MASVDNRKKSLVLALSKHLSLDPSVFPADSAGGDIKTLYLNIIAASGHEVNHSDEVLKWVEFAETLPVSLDGCFEILKRLNDELSGKSVLLGNGLKPSEADVIVFSVIHSSLISLPDTNKEKLAHVLRWVDYIQHKLEFVGLFEEILLQKPEFEPPVTKSAAAVESDLKSNKTEQSVKNVNKAEPETSKDKNKAEVKSTGDTEPAKAKAKPAKPAAKEVSEKENEVSVSLLNIQVGLIRKAWKHPSADSLLVEEIDVGEAKLRQVVSGLAKYCSPDELTNRRVALITNVKPGKLRDVVSEGLVLCASNEGSTIVEPLLPPEGAKIGERVSFAGIDGKPEDVLNPKKKQLEKITPHLFTDDNGMATFKGIPFMTSGGPCTSSISRATIK
ncbi:putative methionine--tRNA ligase [Medicago truncatula]|uniref:Putative methionine--tRNA ligase n=1 Tax=Medicago truncatula TaxID=3880 RepID=A0A072V122_MEDTR|nr:aminoacyl tRNA synthase complex-interacting multifunctional protein 1 [Medicago truncatula]KEH35532.1 tRNA-binding region domain protein [Medicago truncatula]RHN69801.1 putative methionine--tRNA ligase [Medicago truncatula]